MKTLKSIAAISVLLAIFLSLSQPAFPDSLDDVLGVGKTELKESRPETKQLWEDLVTALEQSDFAKAAQLASSFDGVLDFTEPYQKTFTSLTLEILKKQGAAATQPATSQPSATSALNAYQNQIKERDGEIDAAVREITKYRLEIEHKQKELQDAEERRPALLKKSKQGNVIGKVGGAVGSLLGGGAAGAVAGDSQKDNAERDLRELDRQIEQLRGDIETLKGSITKTQQRIETLKQALNGLIKQAAEERKAQDVEHKDQLAARAQADQAQAQAFRNKVLVFLNQLVETNYFRPAVALASAYLKRVGDDAQITGIAQQAVDFQKVQVKAVTVAKAALGPVQDALSQQNLWTAKAEWEKAMATIAERVTDPLLLRFVKVETAKGKADLDRRLQDAMKKRETVMQVADRDAAEGLKQLDGFRRDFPDYPDFDQDKIKIGDLRAQQVEQKFQKKLDAIAQVIPNDPQEAKAMVKKLLTTDIDPDEVSIVKSKITGLQRAIIERELVQVRAQMDEAQSYLTKFDASYAEQVKAGSSPSLSITKTFSVGVENLVRARSVQAGAVKQLEVLLGEDMDNVTKAKVVGLLETQKAAVQQMDDAILQRDRNKLMLVVGGTVICLLAALALVLGLRQLLKRKKSVPVG